MLDRNTVIDSKPANAFLKNVEGKADPRHGEVKMVLWLSKWLTGGVWVGGRLTLTETQLAFAANDMNRALQEGTLDWSAFLLDIRQIVVRPGLVNNVIEIHTGDGTMKFRCWGAKAFSARIEDQVLVLRSRQRED